MNNVLKFIKKDIENIEDLYLTLETIIYGIIIITISSVSVFIFTFIHIINSLN